MKRSSANAPRVLCRLVRWRIALSGQDINSGHVAVCPECQAYIAATQQLDSALRRDAGRQAAPVPEGMDQRILEALRTAPSMREPIRSRSKMLVAFGGLAAGAALALLVVRRSPESAQGGLAMNGHASEADVRAIVAAAQALPQQLWSTLQPTAEKLTDQNPLQTELNSVYSNAQSAVSFLELNFLPSTAAAAPRSGAEQRG